MALNRKNAQLTDDLQIPSASLDGPDLIRELNDKFRRIAETFGAITGAGDRVPAFTSDISLGNNRIKDCANSIRDTDVVPRRELVEKAGYIDSRGQHNFIQPVVVKRLIVRERTREANDALGRAEIIDLIDAAIVSATTGAGTATTIEEITLTGTTGTLSQTPLNTAEVVAIVESSNLVLDNEASVTAPNDFSVSGTTITVHSGRSNSTLKVIYQFTAGSMAVEALSATYPATIFTLNNTPTALNQMVVFYFPANIVLSGTGGVPGVNEFGISGKTLTLGRTLNNDGEGLVIYAHS